MTFRQLAAAGAALAMVTGASDFLLHDGIGHATTPAATHFLHDSPAGGLHPATLDPTAVEYAVSSGVGPISNGHMWDDGVTTDATAIEYGWSGGLRPDATAIEYGL
jgi:hypothetical protein